MVIGLAGVKKYVLFRGWAGGADCVGWWSSLGWSVVLIELTGVVGELQVVLVASLLVVLVGWPEVLERRQTF